MKQSPTPHKRNRTLRRTVSLSIPDDVDTLLRVVATQRDESISQTVTYAILTVFGGGNEQEESR